MHAVAKRNVAVGIARDVDPVRVGKLVRIAVRGADHDMENLALADLLAADLKVFARGPDAALGRCVVAQEFLGGEVDQARIGFELGELIGKLMQPP